MSQLERLDQLFGTYIKPGKKLNIGSAGNKLDGWDNLDMDPRTSPEILCKLGAQNIPCPDNTYSTIVASHIMEHITREDLFPTMLELHRILEPNGHLIAITPYGSSNDAWENPHHLQCFTETTWAYFSKRLYELENHAGFHAYQGQEYADWIIISTNFSPYPEYVNDPEIEWKMKHYRNIIQELHVVMQAVKTVV